MTEQCLEAKIRTQIQHFDSIAERYYVARADGNHRLLKRLMWGCFFEAHQELAGRHVAVLEPMCGYADGKEILERHLGATIDYAGFDFSGNVIARLRGDRPDLNVWQADVTKCELGRECYDLILLLGGLHHVPDAAASVVRRLGSALKPGGLFISLEPTYGNPLFRRARELIYRRNSLFDAGTERAFAVGEITRMFERAGLERVDMLFPGLLSYVLYYNPDAFPALNLGGPRLVELTFAFDRLFMRSALGRALSFATLSLWRRPERCRTDGRTSG